MSTLDIRLFGAMEIRRQGVRLTDFRSQKALALLAYLICNDRPVTRSQLAGLAWPDVGESQALGLLRRTLHDLTSKLPDLLVVDRHTVHFQPATPVTIDALSFIDLVAQHDLNAWTQALDLYRAPFLDGVNLDNAPALESWLLREQEQWQQQVLELLARLIEQYTTQAAYAQALLYARRLVALAPWHEAGHRQVMLLLARTGQPDAALAHYESCRHALQEELGVAPARATQRLRAKLAAIGQLPAQPLPTATTPFIGRTEELIELTALLTNPACRLITLVGAGGMGKTRLALATARGVDAEQQRRFLHGVVFVGLVGVETLAQLVAAVGQALAFTFQPHTPPETQLIHYLQGKELLLVLDNFEQLVNAPTAAFVRQLLDEAPELKLLITSRVRLHLQGEQLYWMQGLAVPMITTMTASPNVAELAIYSSVQLFLAAVQRNQPGYTLAAAEAAAVTTICQLVQGMPLALELAAPWISVLTPAEIAAELTHNLDFLASETHDLPLRQRSMRVVFDSSWRLLTLAEQIVFQQLSIFRGGFTLEAAQAVAGATLPLLARLQQHSFIQYQPDRGRYAIHELVRQFGAEQLAQNEALTELAQIRYSSFFCRLLIQLGAASKTRQQENARHTAEIENENLHAAWIGAVRGGILDLAEPALDGLFRFDEWRGSYEEGEQICALASAHLTTMESPDAQLLRAKLLTWQGIFARYQGQPERTEQLLHSSLGLLEQLALANNDVRAAQAFVKLRIGKFAERMERSKAVSYFEQSLALYQSLDDDWGHAHVLETLGFMALEGEDYTGATVYFKESLRLFQSLGDARGSLRALNQLVVSLTFENKPTEALTCADKAERIVSQIAEPTLVADTLAHKGIVTWYFGRLADVYSCYRRSLAIYEELGDHHTLPNAHLLMSEVLVHLGRIDECHVHLQKTLALIERSGDTFYQGWARMMTGKALVFTNEYEQAEKQFYESIELFSQSGQSRRIGECWSILGIIAIESNDLQRARHCLHHSFRLLKDAHYLPSILLALEVTAFYLVRQDVLTEAVELDALVGSYNLLKTSIWVDMVIRQPIQRATASLSPAAVANAQARGETFDLWATAMRLLERLASA